MATKITIQNYDKESKSIDWSKMPPVLKQGHGMWDFYMEMYDNDEDMQDATNVYLQKLNEALEKQAPAKEKPKVEKVKSIQNGLKVSDMQYGTLIENKNHPDWGHFRVLDLQQKGIWEIRGEAGSRILNDTELNNWKVIKSAPSKKTSVLKFKPGMIYKHGWIGDSDLTTYYLVTRRSKTTIGIVKIDPKTWQPENNADSVNRKINIDDTSEYVSPDGKYSMSPTLFASHFVKTFEPKPTRTRKPLSRNKVTASRKAVRTKVKSSRPAKKDKVLWEGAVTSWRPEKMRAFYSSATGFNLVQSYSEKQNRWISQKEYKTAKEAISDAKQWYKAPVKSPKPKSKKKYDLLFTNAGGYTIASNKLENEYGDYKKIAAIDEQKGTVHKYYVNNLPQTVINKIESFAEACGRPKPKTETSAKAKAPTKAKAPAKPKADAAKLVDKVDIVITFLKRYANLGKEDRTRSYMLDFLRKVERAVLRGQISKSHTHYAKIKHIEKELQRVIAKSKAEGTSILQIEMSEKTVSEYMKIVNAVKTRPSTNALSRYVGLKGRKDGKVKASAERTMTQIKNLLKKFPNDKNAALLRKAQSDIQDFSSGKREDFPVDSVSLAGLGNCPVPPDSIFEPEFLEQDNKTIYDNGIINSNELQNMSFELAGYTGKWQGLFGDVVEPFSSMLWAKPGMGKSTLSIQFAHYLASELRRMVLYVSKEEGKGYTVKEKFSRLNAFDANIDISASLPRDLSSYQYVFLDSVTAMGMSLPQFINLKRNNPNVNFILVFQATVDGNYRGAKDWEHDVDVSIVINENGYAKTQKSRFGGNSSIKIFEETGDPIYKFTQPQMAEKFVANQQKDLRIVQGDDGKIWVTNPDKANELQAQGYTVHNQI